MSYYITRNILENYKNRTVHIEGYIEKFGYKKFDAYGRLVDVDFRPDIKHPLIYDMPEQKYPIKYQVKSNDITTLLKGVTVHVNNRGSIQTFPLDHIWICEDIRMINPYLAPGSYVYGISGVVRQYLRENGTWDYTIVPDFAMK